MYLEYNDYKAFGGSLEQEAFNRLSFRAGQILNLHTLSRLQQLQADQIPEAVKRCEFELIAYLAAHDGDGALRAAQSISNDGYSVTYEAATAQQEIENIIYDYLAETDLLYRGADCL